MDIKHDRSGTITTGGTAQTISTETRRKGFMLQNISDTVMWLRFDGVAAAAAGSLKIPADGFYESPPNWTPPGPISLFCATTGKAFTAWEW